MTNLAAGRNPGLTDPLRRVPHSRDPIARYHLARLTIEADALRADLAARDAWVAVLEDEIDALRATLGLREIPS